MTTFRVTEQDARVIERSYDVEADTSEEAQDALESMDTDEKGKCFVHQETIRTNCEITNVEAIG